MTATSSHEAYMNQEPYARESWTLRATGDDVLTRVLEVFQQGQLLGCRARG